MLCRNSKLDVEEARIVSDVRKEAADIITNAQNKLEAAEERIENMKV